ncbi:RNA-binding protein [Halalkalicoccus sp. NIPERK01]|uniref:RNA-binding protein n=1 Tax=Halalkalicoccus sp. NIPERK01 TaxID=3053469 RepID=UPI00256E9F1D|nr:RNA-binding protein [Halalkalicoccus sp. NIPERK01]MDL5362162.1 RNA-binding protein [Halalkalicoccus sp. NIPERK01]
MEISSRHHLRNDEVRDLEAALSEGLGVSLDGDSYELVELAGVPVDLVLVDGDPDAFYYEGEPFLTVRGANAHEPDRGIVTVDAGAVSFVSDGADVMRPGIVHADEAIEAGDLVAIAEESHGKVLAIGRAKTDGGDMLGDSGKVIESLHHVGDDLYSVTV